MSQTLQVLAIIALVLYIVWGYLMPPIPEPGPAPSYRRSFISIIIVVLVLVCFYVFHLG